MTCSTAKKLTDVQVVRQPWSCRTDLLPHQEEAVAKLLPSRVGALFMDMGTGKTRTAIEFARIRQTKIDRVVYWCPVSLMDTIRYEILKHTTCTPDDVYVFDERTTRLSVPRDAFWYVVGIESMSSSARVVSAIHELVTDRSFTIVDESTYIKGHNSWRTERITFIASRARYRMILTGTPMTQGYVDLFAQMRFLSPRILGYNSFYSFAANHLEYSERFPGMIVRAHNTKYLAAKMQPYVYQITKDDANLDLPPKLKDGFNVPMTDDQYEAYELAKTEILDYMDSGYDEWWDQVRIFRLFTTLQSVVVGRWKTLRGKVIDLKHRRIDVLEEVIEGIPSSDKVVIWARYHFSLNQIVDALTKIYGAGVVTPFHGGIPRRKRDSAINHWRESGRFLVATQGVGGHGLDMSVAKYMIFYANGFKYSERLQAEDRIHRIGQSRRPVYIDLFTSTGIENRIFDALHNKGNALSDFRREIDKVKGDNIRSKVRDLIKTL